MENTKVLQLNENEELMVFNANKAGVLIKNEGGILNITDLNKRVVSNIFVKSLNMNEINSIVLTRLLEDSEVSCGNSLNTQKLINEILEEQFNYICGGDYISEEIKDIQFQAITYFEK